MGSPRTVARRSLGCVRCGLLLDRAGDAARAATTARRFVANRLAAAVAAEQTRQQTGTTRSANVRAGIAASNFHPTSRLTTARRLARRSAAAAMTMEEIVKQVAPVRAAARAGITAGNFNTAGRLAAAGRFAAGMPSMMAGMQPLEQTRPLAAARVARHTGITTARRRFATTSAATIDQDAVEKLESTGVAGGRKIQHTDGQCCGQKGSTLHWEGPRNQNAIAGETWLRQTTQICRTWDGRSESGHRCLKQSNQQLADVMVRYRPSLEGHLTRHRAFSPGRRWVGSGCNAWLDIAQGVNQ